MGDYSCPGKELHGDRVFIKVKEEYVVVGEHSVLGMVNGVNDDKECSG
jgi:hypothetical protein